MSIYQGCTLTEFFDKYGVTGHERKLIIRYLAFLRMCQTLDLIKTLPTTKQA